MNSTDEQRQGTRRTLLSPWLLLFTGLAGAAGAARADIGPKPELQMWVRDAGGAPVQVAAAELLLCERKACRQPRPMEFFGPQRIEVDGPTVYALAYSLEPYARWRLTTASGVRTSNVFPVKGMETSLLGVLTPTALTVTIDEAGYRLRHEYKLQKQEERFKDSRSRTAKSAPPPADPAPVGVTPRPPTLPDVTGVTGVTDVTGGDSSCHCDGTGRRSGSLFGLPLGLPLLGLVAFVARRKRSRNSVGAGPWQRP
jgi:hypothetical protein